MSFFDIFDFNRDTDAMESALGFLILSEEFGEEHSETDEEDF